MKMIYLILFTASATLLVLGSIITFALPIEESFADRLVKAPEQWDIVFAGGDTTTIFTARDPAAAKALLLTFLAKNHMPTYRTLGHVAYGLMMVCVFSLVGLIRESQFKKKQQRAEQSPPPYSSPAAGSETGEA
ncbi:MAG: hypothetical protein GX804_07410 [Lentisphaerae bacterium]|jgi:hypothetical protein|nr:hypothetical protein [Lentisphaerota bacterium]